MATVSLPAAARRVSANIGLAVLLASWGMVFVTLLFAYGVLRSKLDVWPPLGAAPLPVGLAWLNTGVLVASSLMLHRGWTRLRTGDAEPWPRLLAATIALGLLFLGLQTMLWLRIHADGLRIDSGVFGSVVYTFTTFHAAHILCALGLLGAMVPGALQRRYSAEGLERVRMSVMFWHFLDLAWLAIFAAVFLV